MDHYRLKVLSSLEKVFPDEEPTYRPECTRFSGLWGETVSFQIAYAKDGFDEVTLKLKLDTEMAEQIQIRTVEYVPARKVLRKGYDDNYLKSTAGIYPDLLRKLSYREVIFRPNYWNSLWVDVKLTEEIPEGKHKIGFVFEDEEGNCVCSVQTNIEVVGASLPKQELIHTEWLHVDCLADYYQVEVFSEEHWRILENFIQQYAERGCNMILVPLFTPPLDTGKGLERTTVQLVDVRVREGKYEFSFDKLERYINLCRKYGVEYFEMCHLFSQWGAEYAPKIVVDVEGRTEKIFGWHTPSVGKYTEFLHVFIPQLTDKLCEWDIAEKCYFHVSDEPAEAQMDTYMAARESLGTLLKGFRTLDAVSHYEFYAKGLIDVPVPPNNRIHDFLEHDLPERWTYYCVSQYLDVSNRFMAMPSARNRILGVQLYKYDIKGFLHWGYNFYNSFLSRRHVNPYHVTDADGTYPAGDPFIVYPGEGGMPEESIRLMVLNEALNDLRAFKLLESLTDKHFVLDLIEGELAEPITFACYPKSDMFLILLRNRVNKEIAERMKMV